MDYGPLLQRHIDRGHGTPDCFASGSAAGVAAAASAAAAAFVRAGLHHVPPRFLGHISLLCA